MSRIECISNRSIRIIASYVKNKLGHHDGLFEGIPHPHERYASCEEYFLNEDEWTTFENFHKIFRRAKEMVGEEYFYFKCGASSAALRSWGRLHYFVRIFATPCDGYRRIPFFNKTFNDTKDIDIILPPAYNRTLGKIRTILRVEYHEDIDANTDYMGNPYLRGILSSIPTIWGLRPASVKQPLNAFDPEILLVDEPEFAPYGLDPCFEGHHLSVREPQSGKRRIVGKRVLLLPEVLNGYRVYIGKFVDPSDATDIPRTDLQEALLITETVQVDGRIILKAGEIFKAPYFILDITYDGLSLIDRVSQAVRFRRKPEEASKGLIETINLLRKTIEARNRAYHDLERLNAQLFEAKKRVDEYARTLEEKVEERTAELREAQEGLLLFNRELGDKVKEQVEQLRRYDALRRYLSPNLTAKILSSGETLGAEPQRKMMTVLFSDIRNFSAFTDSLEPEELFHLLDRYLEEMTNLVHRYEGTLNKIIGDGLLVFFGDPVPMEDHAERAVNMAIDMQKRVAALKGEWRQYGHELGVGIGINTGYMSVGNIGSDMHKDYTVIGNQVNVAARLESLAKKGQILISQRTFSRAKGFIQAERVGEIRVKGIHNPIITYNVLVADP
ncbi:MAG: hypothetical protein JW821_05010 [Deltaproteobacteria bacterium]|nr:hypothetical protein [Deltaproteobacteria bacterium]